MSKVLIINGSPRAGGNTAIAVREMEAVFRENGVEVTTVQIGGKAIRGCIACGKCAETGRCGRLWAYRTTASHSASAVYRRGISGSVVTDRHPRCSRSGLPENSSAWGG